MMRKKQCVAMLLAGGQGSRLGILTKNVAKPAVMFRIGAAIELKRLGYKFEQVNLPNFNGGVAEC